MAKTIDVTELPSVVASDVAASGGPLLLAHAGREVGIFVPARGIHARTREPTETEEDIEVGILAEIRRLRAKQDLRLLRKAVAADNPGATEEEVMDDALESIREVRAERAAEQ